MATSWGPMQVMGAVAWELGFRGHFVDLCDTRTGIEYGCKKLKELMLKYNSMEDAVSAYNAGRPAKTKGGLYINEQYVDGVMKYYRELAE